MIDMKLDDRDLACYCTKIVDILYLLWNLKNKWS